MKVLEFLVLRDVLGIISLILICGFGFHVIEIKSETIAVSSDNLFEKRGINSHPQGLGKSCHLPTSSLDCLFRVDHLLADHELYLKCQNQECICQPTPTWTPLHRIWNITWDEEMQFCRMAEFGPCGETNRLQIECDRGLICVQSRCRNPRNLQKLPPQAPCFDDIDCQHGYSCSRYNDTGYYNTRMEKHCRTTKDAVTLHPSLSSEWTYPSTSNTQNTINATKRFESGEFSNGTHNFYGNVPPAAKNSTNNTSSSTIRRRQPLDGKEAPDVTLSPIPDDGVENLFIRVRTVATGKSISSSIFISPIYIPSILSIHLIRKF